MTSIKTCVLFEDHLFENMNGSEKKRWFHILKQTIQDRAEGLVMLQNLKRADLNMQFGIVLKPLPYGRVSVELADTRQVVSIKKENVTQHHSVTLDGIITKRYNGQKGTVLSIMHSREVVSRVVEGETPDLSRREEGEPREYEDVVRYEVELWDTKHIHHVKRHNLVPCHCEKSMMLMTSLSAFRQNFCLGDNILFFESDAMMDKRHAEEKRGEIRCAKTQVMWPGGPELVIAQVIAHYGSTETDEVPIEVKKIRVLEVKDEDPNQVKMIIKNIS